MTAHFDYERATVEDVAIYFGVASQQAVSKVRRNNRGTALGEKLEAAFEMMKRWKHERKMAELTGQ